ncbi:MAG: AAC(3) family N-acetyltransferase [bacterium]|nr:AAC(3) family N-acetyltransferase [bacterium]
MSELDIIRSTTGLPATVDSLSNDLKKIGVKHGMVLFVHSSMSSLGWVCGGPAAVILALENVLTDKGTLVMPAFTGDLGDPKNWVDPPVPESWHQLIRDNMPAFMLDLSPVLREGIIPEIFRKQNGVIRSDHPNTSFSAWGKNAELITSNHPLMSDVGEFEPLARLYDLDCSVLFIGTDYSSCTSMHLAEYRADYPKEEIIEGRPIFENGKRKWVEVRYIKSQYDHFQKIGEAFEAETRSVKQGKIAQAESRLFPMRACVNFTIKWFEKNLK